jgi:hypothetical protein
VEIVTALASVSARVIVIRIVILVMDREDCFILKVIKKVITLMVMEVVMVMVILTVIAVIPSALLEAL